MKSVISVIGNDAVGILSKVSEICAESNANVTEVTQSVLQDVFAMVMLVDITSLSTPLETGFPPMLQSTGRPARSAAKRMQRAHIPTAAPPAPPAVM